MTSKQYDLGALKKSRQQIITALKKVSLHLSTHYTLSAAQANSNTFELLPVSKSAKTMEQIKAAIRKHLQDSAAIKDANGGITITPGSLYTQFVKLPVVAKKKAVESNHADFSTFKNVLIQSIERSTNARLDGQKIGFRCATEHINGKQVAVLHCAEQFVTNEILCFLETLPLYKKRIVSVQKNAVTVSAEEIKRKPRRTEVLLMLLYEELRTSFPRVYIDRTKILTPCFVAAQMKTISIEIQFGNQGDAVHFTSNVNQAFAWSKEGSVVTLSINSRAISKVLGAVMLLEKKNRQGLVAATGGHGTPRYVHLSSNYKEFHFLPFNRKVNKKHVMRLVKSLQSFGPQRFVNVAETDCIDGKKKKWVVDGQHLYMGFQFLKMPVLYIISKVSTKEEMVRLIAALNHTAKTWHLRDYLQAWCQLGIPSYVTIERILTETKLPITILLEIFSGQNRQVATTKFQEGKYHIRDLKVAELQVKNLMELRSLLPRSANVYSAMAGFFNSPPSHYSNTTMKERLKAFHTKKRQLPFGPEDTRDELIKKLKSIYAGKI